MGQPFMRVETGTKTLKDAADAAFGAWMADLMPFTFWSCCWPPHPLPNHCAWIQKVISEESKRQILKKKVVCRLCGLPVSVVVQCHRCLFSEYVAEEEVGFDWGRSSWTWFWHRSTRSELMTKGTIGGWWDEDLCSLFGEDGKVAPVYLISAGLTTQGWSRARFL